MHDPKRASTECLWMVSVNLSLRSYGDLRDRRHSTATEDVWFGYWYGRQRTLCRCAYEPSKARSMEHLMLDLVRVTL